jgi:ubiquinone/menaquinone biosynthesis C-methylase UbiE
MARDKNARVCPMGRARFLDIGLRRLAQNPRKMLAPYVKEGMTAMDLGCGPGFFTLDLARMVGETGQVIAADLQEEMLQMLKRKIQGTELEKRIELHKCRESSIHYAGRVDFVLALYVVHELPGQVAIFRELHSILNPGGLLYVAEPPFHVTKADFERSIAKSKDAGFKIAERPELLFSKAAVLRKS